MALTPVPEGVGSQVGAQKLSNHTKIKTSKNLSLDISVQRRNSWNSGRDLRVGGEGKETLGRQQGSLESTQSQVFDGKKCPEVVGLCLKSFEGVTEVLRQSFWHQQGQKGQKQGVPRGNLGQG